MNPTLIRSEDFYFENYLEIAAIKRTVVEVFLKAKPDQGEKIFVKRLIYEGNQVEILTTKEDRLKVSDILGISTALDEAEVSAISCACK